MSIDFTSDPGLSGAPGPRRWWFFAVVVILLAIGIAIIVRSQLPAALTEGVWLSEGDSTRIALVFESTRGLISGSMHEIREGKQLVQWGFAGTDRESGDLELIWASNNSLTLSVDLRLGELRGRLLRADGSEHGMVFHRQPVNEVWGLAAQDESPYQLRPPIGGSGWDLAAPAEVGIDPDGLERTYQALTRGEAGLIHSFLVVRGGKLVAEEYFHGYSRDDLHQLQSASKSIASLLVGIALDRGEIESLDQPVLDYFPDYADSARPGWERVNLRHLLTMTAGVDWDRREVNAAHGTGPALFQKVFSRQIVHEPGSRWVYNGAEVNLLAGVLWRATGMRADDYASRHLFDPLGIEEWDWEEGKTDGFPSLAGTLHLRPLDMAKIGQLVLARGSWQGRQVVSEDWIRESTAPSVDTNRSVQKYGYLWWRLGAPIQAGPHPVTIASGWGSQFIHVVPAFDAVLVTTGGNHLNAKTFAIDRVLLENLVPGIER